MPSLVHIGKSIHEGRLLVNGKPMVAWCTSFPMATIPLSAQRMLVALRQMNRDEGISQIDLAAKVGVSQGRISDYLRGDPPKQDKVERFAASFRIRPEFFADPELGDAPNYRDFVGRGPSVVDRDDTKGAPAVEAFIEARAELGMPLPEEAIRSLRSTFYKTGFFSSSRSAT